MTLSGPKACLGSTNDARMRPHFLHSPVNVSLWFTVEVIQHARRMVWYRGEADRLYVACHGEEDGLVRRLTPSKLIANASVPQHIEARSPDRMRFSSSH